MNPHPTKDTSPYPSPSAHGTSYRHRDSLNSLLRHNLGALPPTLSPLVPGSPTHLGRDGSLDLNGLIQEAIDIVEEILGTDSEETLQESRPRRHSPRQ